MVKTLGELIYSLQDINGIIDIGYNTKTDNYILGIGNSLGVSYATFNLDANLYNLLNDTFWRKSFSKHDLFKLLAEQRYTKFKTISLLAC